MNPPVYCLNCGEQQDWDFSHWGIGPWHRRVHFVCKCGWWIEVTAKAPEMATRLARTPELGDPIETESSSFQKDSP